MSTHSFAHSVSVAAQSSGVPPELPPEPVVAAGFPPAVEAFPPLLVVLVAVSLELVEPLVLAVAASPLLVAVSLVPVG
jgi:hypothetical protein